MTPTETSQGLIAHVFAEYSVGCASQIDHGQAVNAVAELRIHVEADDSTTELEVLTQEHRDLSGSPVVDRQQWREARDVADLLQVPS